MSKKTPNIKVNLLPRDPFLESTIGKILVWTMSFGRYVIIFTELIVVMTFVSRFQLDRRLTDLNSEISKYSNIVKSYQNVERQIGQIQKIQDLVTDSSQEMMVGVLNDLPGILPIDVRLVELGTTKDAVRMKALALSSAGLAHTSNSIKKLIPNSIVNVESVTIDERSGGIIFQLDISQSKKSNAAKSPKTTTAKPDDNSDVMETAK